MQAARMMRVFFLNKSLPYAGGARTRGVAEQTSHNYMQRGPEKQAGIDARSAAGPARDLTECRGSLKLRPVSTSFGSAQFTFRDESGAS